MILCSQVEKPTGHIRNHFAFGEVGQATPDLWNYGTLESRRWYNALNLDGRHNWLADDGGWHIRVRGLEMTMETKKYPLTHIHGHRQVCAKNIGNGLEISNRNHWKLAVTTAAMTTESSEQNKTLCHFQAKGNFPSQSKSQFSGPTNWVDWQLGERD